MSNAFKPGFLTPTSNFSPQQENKEEEEVEEDKDEEGPWLKSCYYEPMAPHTDPFTPSEGKRDNAREREMREKRGKVEKKGREKQRGREKGESECVHERNINVMRDREKRNRKGERIREREMERAGVFKVPCRSPIRSAHAHACTVRITGYT